MGFKTGNFPPVDVDTFLERPLLERVKTLALHWVEYGFGSPKMIPSIYVVKVAVLYIVVGLWITTATSDLPAFWHVDAWWNQPIVYEKMVIWTMFLEAFGLAGSWGPIAGKFKPMMGHAVFWLRPGTLRQPPWPDKVPGTAGDERSVFDVAIYAGLLGTLLWAMFAKGTDIGGLGAVLPDNTSGLVRPSLLVAPLVLLVLCGLRDKTIFIAARSEQHAPALIMFYLAGHLGTHGFVDMIVMLKLLVASVWIGAGISKIGVHFSNVVPPMASNGPLMPGRALRRAHYKNFPTDIRPSALGHFMAHVGGTCLEIGVPLILLFNHNHTVAVLGALALVALHTFIISLFPLAVPLEWNVLFGYAAVFLFLGFPNAKGYGLGDISSPWLLVATIAALTFFPILGNLRPDLVAFTPSMRQYAGNWASALWAFQPGCEEKLNLIKRPTTNQVQQLEAMGYAPAVAEITMQQTVGWRSMHSQGRGLLSLIITRVKDVDKATVREAEFACNSIIGFNFGDGHLHNWRLIEAIQKRCNFAPGEFVVAWVESQPIHKRTQNWMVIDAALGIVERGTWDVHDCVRTQPWLPDGPIPLNSEWRHPAFNEQKQEVS